MQQQNTVSIGLEQRFQLTRLRIKQSLDALLKRNSVNGEFGEIGDLLRSLPLATDQFALASRRLANAHRYLTAGERGAAVYELHLLEGVLFEPADIVVHS